MGDNPLLKVESSADRRGGRNNGEKNGSGRDEFAGGMIPDNKDDTDNVHEFGRVRRMKHP